VHELCTGKILGGVTFLKSLRCAVLVAFCGWDWVLV
jgi:hypothetical protein